MRIGMLVDIKKLQPKALRKEVTTNILSHRRTFSFLVPRATRAALRPDTALASIIVVAASPWLVVVAATGKFDVAPTHLLIDGDINLVLYGGGARIAKC